MTARSLGLGGSGRPGRGARLGAHHPQFSRCLRQRRDAGSIVRGGASL